MDNQTSEKKYRGQVLLPTVDRILSGALILNVLTIAPQSALRL